MIYSWRSGPASFYKCFKLVSQHRKRFKLLYVTVWLTVNSIKMAYTVILFKVGY